MHKPMCNQDGFSSGFFSWAVPEQLCNNMQLAGKGSTCAQKHIGLEHWGYNSLRKVAAAARCFVFLRIHVDYTASCAGCCGKCRLC